MYIVKEGRQAGQQVLHIRCKARSKDIQKSKTPKKHSKSCLFYVPCFMANLPLWLLSIAHTNLLNSSSLLLLSKPTN